MKNGDQFLNNYARASTAFHILHDIALRDIHRERAGEPPWEGGPTYRELVHASNEALRLMFEEYCAATGYTPQSDSFKTA